MVFRNQKTSGCILAHIVDDSEIRQKTSGYGESNLPLFTGVLSISGGARRISEPSTVLLNFN